MHNVLGLFITITQYRSSSQHGPKIRTHRSRVLRFKSALVAGRAPQRADFSAAEKRYTNWRGRESYLSICWFMRGIGQVGGRGFALLPEIGGGKEGEVGLDWRGVRKRGKCRSAEAAAAACDLSVKSLQVCPHADSPLRHFLSSRRSRSPTEDSELERKKRREAVAAAAAAKHT